MKSATFVRVVLRLYFCALIFGGGAALYSEAQAGITAQPALKETAGNVKLQTIRHDGHWWICAYTWNVKGDTAGGIVHHPDCSCGNSK